MEIPSLLEMLQSGVHFGHQTSKWHPRMKEYIFGVRKGFHIVNLELTEKKLKEAITFVQQIVGNGGQILFIGTKKQGCEVMKKNAEMCGMPCVHNRWLGGTLTNFDVVHKLVRKYKDIKYKKDKNQLLKYTKKERLDFDRELERLETLVGGILNLDKLPDAVFILDLKKEKTAFLEAIKRNIPVIAICDTNVNPEKVAYPIPANDDATKSINLMTGAIAKAIVNTKPKTSNQAK